MDLLALAQSSKSQALTKARPSTRIKYKTPKERLKLPGSWRHIVSTDPNLNHEIFTEINHKVEGAIVRCEKLKLIGLLNRGKPISIEIDHISGSVHMLFKSIVSTKTDTFEIPIYLSLKEINGRLRIAIRNEYANLLVYDIRQGDVEDEPLTEEEIENFHNRYKHENQSSQGTNELP